MSIYNYFRAIASTINMCEMWQICRRIKCSVPMQILLVFLFLTSIVGLSLLKLHLKNSVGEERDSGQFEFKAERC